MASIAYLLHHFPQITDTFIKREIRSLQKSGVTVHVISMWKSRIQSTTHEVMAEWENDTQFVLPKNPAQIAWIVLRSFVLSPVRFFVTLRLALTTSRAGISGHIYQVFYLIEAILAADVLRRNGDSHVHNHIGDHAGTVAMLAAKLAGIGYSITFHGWPVFFDAKNAHIKEKVRGATFTRCISYFCRSQLMFFSECEDPAPFKVVHCGLDIGKYKFRLPRQEIKTLFCAARLSNEKGLVFLIRALSILRRQGHDLEVRLAGNGPSRDRLETLTNELGLSAHVHFLGFLNEDEVITELQSSDLFVLPSFVEGLPVSAMEAMAIGVPVIATNIAATSELIEHGKTGLLIRPSDIKILVEAIIHMIGDYQFRLSAAELARKKIVEEFDIEKETANLNRYLLESCVHNTRREAAFFRVNP